MSCVVCVCRCVWRGTQETPEGGGGLRGGKGEGEIFPHVPPFSHGTPSLRSPHHHPTTPPRPQLPSTASAVSHGGWEKRGGGGRGLLSKNTTSKVWDTCICMSKLSTGVFADSQEQNATGGGEEEKGEQSHTREMCPLFFARERVGLGLGVSRDAHVLGHPPPPRHPPSPASCSGGLRVVRSRPRPPQPPSRSITPPHILPLAASCSLSCQPGYL